MIQFANNKTAIEVISLWKQVFGDTDEYIKLFFSRQYKNENTLIHWVDGKVVASLQMIPYSIRFYGEVIPFYYLAGLCTLPQYRQKGYMKDLIYESFSIMRERNIPLSILVPAEEWLFEYYEKFGFSKTFEKSTDDLKFKNFVETHQIESKNTYTDFNKTYQEKDFCVLKSEYDFETIIQEFKLDNCPIKYNLSAMSRIIDPLLILGLYANKNTDSEFIMKVDNKIYEIKNGAVKLSQSIFFDIEVDIKKLTRLLFGFQTSELSNKYFSLFKEHQPIINLMLE